MGPPIEVLSLQRLSVVNPARACMALVVTPSHNRSTYIIRKGP